MAPVSSVFKNNFQKFAFSSLYIFRKYLCYFYINGDRAIFIATGCCERDIFEMCSCIKKSTFSTEHGFISL